ncbi:MAG: hypothetical protein HW421_3751 [Ignavibacteria bacterium]|nr:hypothetical protein [Ignavibacteria bacterium]
MLNTQEIKIQLHNSIENINDSDFLLTVKEIIDKKENLSDDIELSGWQMKRIKESKEQIKQGKYFSNIQADLLVEKWLQE